ncbi:L-threonylcarbamoyladenylate synthase [Naumannella halotolerans]|uniref:L-threonylcarbamoyladenylate synthase n=1 Tax=Naumannella halotolerans TaxID=993414 RepID=UPI00370DADF0
MSSTDRPGVPGDPAPSRILPTDDVGEAAARARRLIVAGKCVVLPTDTVYGIAADAFDAEAVQRLLDAKGRGRDMPPPVLVADPEVAMALATDVPPAARELMERFWPGPLTLVLTAQRSLRLDLGDADGTVAIRIPDHEIARAVLRVTGPLAVSSANKTGQPAARTAQEAELQLGLSVAGYLDAGRSSDGPSSTIVDFVSTPDGALLRVGGIGVEELREVLPALHVPPELAQPEGTESAKGRPNDA